MPKSKQMFVRNIRMADSKDLSKIENENAKVPIYAMSVYDKVKDMDADAIGHEIAKNDPKNIVKHEKVTVGFVSIFEMTKKTTYGYTDYGGQTVTVLATLDGQKATFEGQIIGTNGYVVFVKYDENTVFLCPIQSGNCWMFA